jgi:hypothetical protein
MLLLTLLMFFNILKKKWGPADQYTMPGRELRRALGRNCTRQPADCARQA